MSSRISALVVVTLICTLFLQAQSKTPILTGAAAAKLFLYAGKPIHPFCLDFPFDSSRMTPIELSRCNDTPVQPSITGTELSADYPDDGGARLSLAGISYNVLASKAGRFLIWSAHSGGGSGQFTDLFWVRLDSRQLTYEKGEIGGDRCAGRVDIVRTEASAIRISQAVSTVDLLELASAKLDPALASRLRSGYAACDGTANYRYDLRTEKPALLSVSLGRTEPENGDPLDPQICFDRLAQQYAKAKNSELNPAELKTFGRKFLQTCVQAAPGRPI